MNWHCILENADTLDRQQLIKVCYSAGCWYTCPSAALLIERDGLGSPVDPKLYALARKFHECLNAMLSEWENVHFYNKRKKFRAQKIIAINLLNKIQNYDTGRNKVYKRSL